MVCVWLGSKIIPHKDYKIKIETTATFILPQEPRKYEKLFFGRLYSSIGSHPLGLVASSKALFLSVLEKIC